MSVKEVSVSLVKFNMAYKFISELYDLASHLNNPTPDQLRKFKVRFADVNRMRQQMDDTFAIIMAVNDERHSKADYEKRFNTFYDMFYTVNTVHEDLFETQCAPSEARISGSSNAVGTRSFLPQIGLSRFNGTYTEWPNFISIFNSLVHENSEIKDTNKLHFLLSVLDNEPLSLIRHLNITGSNYGIAYKILMDRYENKRLIADKHLELLLAGSCNTLVHKNLRKFVNNLKENSLALTSLGYDVNSWSFILFHIISRKMPSELRTKFEFTLKPNEAPEFSNLLIFLENHLRVLDTTSNTSTKTPSSHASTTLHASQSTCICCGENHPLYHCPKFDKLDDKRAFVKSKNLCFNCLRSHHVSKCLSKSVCQICRSKHHTKLHVGNTSVSNDNTSTSSEKKTSNESTPSVVTITSGTCNAVSSTPSVSGFSNASSSFDATSDRKQIMINAEPSSTGLLGTALVGVQDINGHVHVARALIDPGAQVSIMTEHLAQQLRLPRRKSCTLFGVGEHRQSTHGMVDCRITSLCDSSHPGLFTDAVVLKRITAYQPVSQVSRSVYEKCEHLMLADNTFHTPGRIDILLGVVLFDEIFTGSKHKLGPGFPTCHSTIFGWVIMGHSPMAPMNCQSVNALTCNSSLEFALSKFWETEEAPAAPVPDPEDIACERHFAETHSRDENGKFIVRLPFKVELKQLGDTRHAALKRFHNLERRLMKDPKLRELYIEFMRDYQAAGHMKLKASDASGERCYIPHHGVLKESSSTTKLRAVFDASLVSSSGVSLNQNLMSGPKLQQDIHDIILRFRLHAVVFTCDIKQMYRNVRMHEQDCRYQTIFWRESPEEPLQEFELTTVTYGVSSSAFQAIRVIHELANLNAEAYPEATRILREDTFVDDVVSGCGSLDDARILQRQIVDVLGQGCFHLRKWSSNRGELLDGFPVEHCETPFRFEDSGDNVFKILGMEWNPSTDNFLYRVSKMTRATTKRGVLSNIARLYDPCGFITPVTFFAKSFMQNLWLLDLNWDDPLPSDVQQSWSNFTEDFEALNKIRISRFILHGKPDECHIHGFSDASERGYAACIYLLVKCGTDTYIHLLLSKSRVAPVSQKMTIPRLELCGALLLARLLEHASKGLHNNIKVGSTTAWCDSSIVLSWLQTSPHKLQTFEGNRVSQIRGMIPDVPWRHVSSSLNPADCASRGILPSDLINHHLWWGPEWLINDISAAALPVQAVKCLEQTFSGTFVHQVQVPDKFEPQTSSSSPRTGDNLADLLLKFSSLAKLQSTVGWCLRFFANTRQVATKATGHLTIKELDVALLTCVRLVQAASFSDSIYNLQHNKPIKGSLSRLHPFLDGSGLLRVGGRLQNSNLPYDSKHPLLLPHGHHLTHLIVDHYHQLFGHPGPATLLVILQRRFWILSARRVVRHRIYKCQRCYRLKAKPLHPFMGNLPSGRVNQARPFQRVGVDFAGPFIIKTSSLRSTRTHKAYLCVFICFSVKAVHLEVVSELSTEAFLACLDRFVARRGLPSDIHSDCGTNFVGARNQLREVYKLLECSDIQRKLTTQNINWHFNPPSGPHLGGLWESAVKSSKTLLKRIIGERVLTLEELFTVFAKIEAIINSRPLCPLSNDPNDLEVLTPGHFLIGQPLLAVPEPNVEQIQSNRLNRWQLLHQINQHFWRRWHNEYLHTLQQRDRWLKQQPNLQVGDLVLLIEPNLTPLEWRKARIIRVCPGSDGIVRVVEIKTSKGILTRPVVKLCPLFRDN